MRRSHTLLLAFGVAHAATMGLSAQESKLVSGKVTCDDCVVTLDTVVTIGGLDGPGLHAVTRYSQVAVDRRSRILITALRQSEISVFDTTGKFLQTVGPVELLDTLVGDTVNLWTYMERRHSRGWTDWLHPDSFRAAVIRHEGYGSVSGNDMLKGHQGQIEKALRYETCGDGAVVADKVVTASAERADMLVEMIDRVAASTFLKAAGHHKVHGHFRTYIPAWWPGRAPEPPIDRLLTDTAEQDTLAPINRCDWTLF